MSSVDAPEGARLRELGVPEVSSNTHPGQGTACRRFAFRNAYLELLWVCDAQEAQSETIQRTQLWDRWVNRRGQACPFGIVLRPAGDTDGVPPPFAAWEYQPPYLPAPLAIHVARDVPVHEPAFFYLGFQRSQAQLGPASVAEGVRATITHVTIGTTVPARSMAVQTVQAMEWFGVETSEQHIMRLCLDGGDSGHVTDLQPELPLVLQW